MLEEKSVLDKPNILRRESTIEPVKPKRKWLRNLILIALFGLLIYYLLKHPEIMREAFDKLLGNLLK